MILFILYIDEFIKYGTTRNTLHFAKFLRKIYFYIRDYWFQSRQSAHTVASERKSFTRDGDARVK